MSHKVLSSDMANLVHSLKLAQEYSTTLLDGEYRKGMLQAAHVLAMDAKHLLDTVEGARKSVGTGVYSNTTGIKGGSMDGGAGGGGGGAAGGGSGGGSHTRSLSSSSQAGFLSSGAPPLHSGDS
jgi:uncharacterized membrane protein